MLDQSELNKEQETCELGHVGCSGHHDLEETSQKQAIIPAPSQLEFAHFLELFRPVDLPCSITSDTERLLGLEQDPLAEVWMTTFVLSKEEADELDEFSEFMACYRLPKTEKIHALIYWMASLHGSSYYLATFSTTGTLIDRLRIGGLAYGEDKLTQTVCSISPKLLISVMDGQLDAHTGRPLPVDRGTQVFYQLNQDGEIVEL